MTQKNKDKVLTICGVLIVILASFLYAWILPAIKESNYIRGYEDGYVRAFDTMEVLMKKLDSKDSVLHLKIKCENRDTFSVFLTSKYPKNEK